MGKSDAQDRMEELSKTDFQDIMDEATAEAEKKFKPIYKKIGALGEQASQIPTFEEWLAQNNYQLGSYDEQMQGMQDIIDQIQGGPSEEDYANAAEYAASQFGLTGDEYQQLISDLTNQMAEGSASQEGLTPEQEDAIRRQNQSSLREMEDRSRRLIQDTFADTGSTARMLQTAYESTTQINDAQIQQEVSLVQQDAEMAISQYQSLQATWQQMLETNQISEQQYLDNINEGASLAFEGYAQQVNTIYMQNQEYFQAYQNDLNAMVASIDATYKSIQLEIGATSAEIDYANSLYSQQVQPILDEMNALLANEEMNADSGFFGNLFGGTFGDILDAAFGVAMIAGGIAVTVATGGAAAPLGAGLVAGGVGMF